MAFLFFPLLSSSFLSRCNQTCLPSRGFGPVVSVPDLILCSAAYQSFLWDVLARRLSRSLTILSLSIRADFESTALAPSGPASQRDLHFPQCDDAPIDLLRPRRDSRGPLPCRDGVRGNLGSSPPIKQHVSVGYPFLTKSA
jgi:hypothetical protein